MRKNLCSPAITVFSVPQSALRIRGAPRRWFEHVNFTFRIGVSLLTGYDKKSLLKGNEKKITTKLMNAVNVILCHDSWIVVRGGNLQPQYATRVSAEKDESLERLYADVVLF